MERTESQCKMILDYLESGNSITQADAYFKFGCFRLASRISDLKNKGHNIVTNMITNGDRRYASYTLKQ